MHFINEFGILEVKKTENPDRKICRNSKFNEC